MFNQHKNKSAFTLIELVIVMALIALISGLVISYSVFISNYIDTADNLNTSINEVSTVRGLIENWFSYYDSSDYSYGMKQSQQSDSIYVLTAKNSENEYYLDVALNSEGEPVLNLTYPDEKSDVSYNLSYVQTISFQGTDKANIYRCEVLSGSGTLRFLLVRHSAEGTA